MILYQAKIVYASENDGDYNDDADKMVLIKTENVRTMRV